MATILNFARERDELRVVNDQYGCPTATADLAQGLRRLMEGNARGIYHLAGSGQASWHELAAAAVAAAGLTTSVLPVTSAEFPRPARRPQYSVLSCEKFERTTGWQMPAWQEALKKYVAALAAEGL